MEVVASPKELLVRSLIVEPPELFGGREIVEALNFFAFFFSS